MPEHSRWYLLPTSVTFNPRMRITVILPFFAFMTFPSIQTLPKILSFSFFFTFLAVGFLQLLTSSSYSLSPISRSL